MVFALFLMPAAVGVLHAAAVIKKRGAANLIREGAVVASDPTATLPPRLITEEEWKRMQASESAAEVRAINVRAERRAAAAGIHAVRSS